MVDGTAIATAVKTQGMLVLETMYITLRPSADGAVASFRMVTSSRDLAKRRLLEAEQLPVAIKPREILKNP